MQHFKIITFILIIYFVEAIICFGLVALDPEDDRNAQRKPLISTNKVSLVKRLVPRDYETPQFEYDRKLKTIFVPKYRVHKRKPIRNGKVSTELYKLFFEPVYDNQKPIAILELDKQNGRDVLRQKEYDSFGSNGRPRWRIDVKEKRVDTSLAHNSLYNYWTYDKAILHDLCPPHQAKLGYQCIYAPMAVSR